MTKLMGHRCFILAVAIVGSLSACVHGDDQSTGPVIVERSKAQAPTWTEQKPAQLDAASGFYRYVHLVPEFANLPLGIKRAQILGIAAMRTALKRELEVQFEGLAKARGIDTSSIRDAVLSSLEEVVSGQQEPGIKVADIYYEKLRPDLAAGAQDEFYRAFVMVQAPTAIISSWSKSLGERLLKEKESQLQAAGRLLTNVESNPSDQQHGH